MVRTAGEMSVRLVLRGGFKLLMSVMWVGAYEFCIEWNGMGVALLE